MNRIKGLALGLGLAALMVVGFACGAGDTQDPAEGGPASDSPQAQGQPRPSGSAGEMTAPDEEPSTFDDSANLAANPDVATVIIGQVVEKSGEKTLPLARNSNSVRFGYWDVRVERYLVTVLPYTEITVRLEQMFVRPDGSLVPTRFPIILNPGERAVFFLTQTPGPNRPLLEGNTFTLAGSGPGGLGGNRTIEDGQVNTLLNGQSRWEPLEEFIDRIVRVAKGAGEKQDPAEAEPVSDAPLAQGHPGPSGSPAANTSPVIPHGTPRVNLTYEGAVYYQIPLSTDDAANLNEDDLELVGATTESNLLLPAGSELRRFILDLNHDNPELTLSEIKDRVEAKFQIGLDKSTVGRTLQGLNIYKLKDGEEGYVYTLAPGQSFRNEDGTTIRFEAEWQRWAAADSNGT